MLHKIQIPGTCLEIDKESEEAKYVIDIEILVAETDALKVIRCFEQK
jgi:hypothetical protein